MSTRIYDVLDPAFHADPFPIYARLRNTRPVHHDEGRGFWALSRFADVLAAARDPETFSSWVVEADALLPQLNFLDGPQHHDLRALVSLAFTPRRVAELEPLVTAIVDDLFHQFASNGGGDLVADFSGPLASRVVGSLIGIPESRLEEFRHWTDQLSTLGQTGEVGRLRSVAGAIYELFGDLLVTRRADPTDDLMSALVTASIDGRALTQDEILGFCFLLVSGGNDTTTHLIATGAVLLTENPETRATLAGDPTKLPAAIEEMLRLEPPAQLHSRTTTRSVEVQSVTIPARSRVLLLWGSANRDEREFTNPDAFDLERTNTRHLGFGFGPHFCLGASLARLEARVAFAGLLARWPDYEFAEPPTRLLSPWARGFEQVPIAI
jgi:cytochrome P450 family 130